MKDTKWKKLSQKTLLTHPRLSVYEDTVELPNGYRTTYVHLGHDHNAAMVIAQRSDGEILLQREYSYPQGEWLYQFPGGAVKLDEDMKAGAEREFAEEAKLKGVLSKLGEFYLYNRRLGGKFYVYMATELYPYEAEGDVEEDIESYWFKESEIDAMIKNGDILNSSALAGWALYKAAKL